MPVPLSATGIGSKIRSRRQFRRGAVALEFGIVIIIFLVALVGMIELSRAIMVHQVLVNAAREGARRAIVPAATDADLTGTVAVNGFDGSITKYVQAAGIPATYTTQILVNGTAASLSTARTHDSIEVRVQVPYADASWGMLTFFQNNTVLTAAVVMRKE